MQNGGEEGGAASGVPVADREEWVGEVRECLAANRLERGEGGGGGGRVVDGGVVGVGSHGQVVGRTGVGHRGASSPRGRPCSR